MKKIYVKLALALITCGLLFSCANPVNNEQNLLVAEQVSATELVQYNEGLSTNAKFVTAENIAIEVFNNVIKEFDPINQEVNKFLGEKVVKDPRNSAEIEKMASFQDKYNKKFQENSKTNTNFSLSETINLNPGVYDLKNPDSNKVGTGKIITYNIKTINSVKFVNDSPNKTVDSNTTINSVTTIPDASKINLSHSSTKYIKAYKAANAMSSVTSSSKENTKSQIYLNANYVIMFDNVSVSNSSEKYQGILLVNMTTSMSGNNPDKISASLTFYDINGNVTLPTITQTKG